MHSLKKQFTGKVKLIYIDPPYNTGNDGFKYNDNFNHSTWLTFMKNRLEVARELLRDDGVIFVQCDDNEQAYLKILMDEVFGNINFDSNITVIVKTEGRRYGNLAKTHEYILVYAKNIYQAEMYELEIQDKKFSYKDDLGGFDLTDLRNQNTVAFNSRNRPNLRYSFFVDEKNPGKNNFLKVKLENEVGLTEVLPVEINGNKSVWRWGKDKSKIEAENNLIARKGSDGMIRIYQKYRSSSTMPKTTWFDKEFISNKGTKELQAIFGKSVFVFPKPEGLIRKIIEISTQPNDIVLDYHLGSGTTCAVAHKMGRQYIGIEQMDYVETIAVERLKKVIGISTPPSTDGTPQEGNFDTGGISKSVNWQGGGDFIYFELAKWNETAKEKIEASKSLKELIKFFDEMYERYFLNYNLKIKEFREKVIKEEEFKNLSLDEQKKMFVAMLDNNQMYVNKTEMADKKFGISEEDQRLTEEFYKSEK